MDYLHHVSFGIGILGVLVIVFGVAGGLTRLLRTEVRSARGRNVEEDRKRLRQVLGYYLLLGQEFLIAADIIAEKLHDEVVRQMVCYPEAVPLL